ncbi:MAG: leucyl aminopeptidase [Myxococcota bacterium]
MQTHAQEMTSVDITKQQADLLVVAVSQQQNKQTQQPQLLIDQAVASSLSEALGVDLMQQTHEQGFFGKEGEQFVLHSLGKVAARCVALVGFGSPKNSDELCPDSYRRWAASSCRLATKMRAQHVILCLPPQQYAQPSAWLQAVYEGAWLSSYRFDRYMTQDKQPAHNIQQLTVLCAQVEADKQIAQQASGLAKGVCLARDLINEGASVVTPQFLAQHATKLGQQLGLQVDVLDEQQLQQERMNMMLAVGKAASACTPPRLIRLAYEPSNAAASTKRIVLVGKGITFDSGGLNLKPTSNIRDMKYDMSGSACVFGTLVAAARMQLPYPVVGYLACAENGVGAHAYHPGDVLRSRKGITVEIDNTDAEGRLVLADAIDYACERDKPHVVIDVATLTGACLVALGQRTGGLFCSDYNQASTICRLAKDQGELFWPLPLDIDSHMEKELKSTVADIKNCGSRYAGSSTAALFLRKFVPNNVWWGHLDIAGAAFAQKEEPYIAKGGTGFAVRTLIALVQHQQQLWADK